MTKEEANKEAIKIFDERNKKARKIIDEAKRNGTWVGGLDGDKTMFKEIDDEAKTKLKLLKSLIDED